MSTINRYTKIQPERYNPMSLQELMVAPAYMRKSHDEITGKIAEEQSALAQADSMDVHSDLVREKQAILEEEMNKQLEGLQRNGFVNSSKSDFLRLNQMYQKEVGPGGTIGKAMIEKKNWEARVKDISARAEKAGNSPEATKDRIDEERIAYNERFKQSGEIESWKGIEPPKYENLDNDIQRIKGMLGLTSKQSAASSGFYTEVDPTTGLLVIKTKSGSTITTDNAEQIKSAQDYLNNKWFKKGGGGTESAAWNNLSPEMIAERINSGTGMMKVKTIRDNRSTNYQFKGDTGPKNVNGSSLISSLNIFTPEEFAYNDFRKNTRTLEELENKENKTTEDKIKINKLKTFNKEVERTLAEDPSYQRWKNERDTAKDKLKLGFDADEVYVVYNNDNNSMSLYEAANGIEGGTAEYFIDGRKLNDKEESIILDYQKSIENINNNMNRISSDITSKTVLKNAGYSFAPMTSKENTEYKLLNDAFGNAMKTGDFRNLFNIEGIDINEGIHRTNLKTDDKNKIAGLVRAASSGAFKIVSYIPKGASGLPEYIIEIQTNEGNKLSLDKVSRSERGDGDNLANGKAVTIRLSFEEDFSSGMDNINGLTLNYLSMKGKMNADGQTDGFKIAMEARKAKYSNRTWNEVGNRVMSDGILYRGIMRQIKIDKSGAYDSIKQDPYLLKNPDLQGVELINKYLEFFGDELITLE